MKEDLLYGCADNLLTNYLKANSFSSVYVLTDTNTSYYCLPLIKKSLPVDTHYLEVTAGETHKNLESCQYIWDSLKENAARNSLLICLGGGVITDIGGFCASVFKRGIRLCAVPTTLLGMADAAIGGKTGIDYGGEKNLIGTFYNAESIIIDLDFLKTLPERQIRAGFAEMLKYGLIYDRELWGECINPEMDKMALWLRRCVEIKTEIIIQDPLDHHLRKILNFGHTIGHALESYSLIHDDSPLLHGEAIATGMILETMLSNAKGLIKHSEAEEVIHRLVRLYEPNLINKKTFPEIMNLIRHDKKNSGGYLKFSLISGIGRCSYDVVCSEEEILEVLNSNFAQ